MTNAGWNASPRASGSRQPLWATLFASAQSTQVKRCWTSDAVQELCIAALLVGPTGRVIGFDLTPAMVHKARANAERTGLANVTVYEADVAQVPLPDASADVVISNGAINLLPDKASALREAFRVLKLGGRLHIADMIRDETAPPCESMVGESWADCVGGTVTAGCFLQLLAEIGFEQTECVKTTGYRTSASTIGALFFAQKPSQ
jgi:arsenite methyltransferase